MPPAVTGLATTVVKGTRLRSVPEVTLESGGAPGDRRFYLIDERGRMVNGKQLGPLSAVVADYAADEHALTLTFPDGSIVVDRIEAGEDMTTRFYSRSRRGRLVGGPWASALSDYLGQPLRLVESPGSVDRGARGAASLISRASLDRLAQAAGEPGVDVRRFRMLIEIDGVAAHAEDEWVGRRVTVGAARIAFHGHVGRCLITSRDPDTGEIDLPTLDLLRDYRRELDTTEPLPFGIYGEVIEAGRIRVGDPVVPETSSAPTSAECRDSDIARLNG
jgi:uncharacterized protein YcbX